MYTSVCTVLEFENSTVVVPPRSTSAYVSSHFAQLPTTHGKGQNWIIFTASCCTFCGMRTPACTAVHVYRRKGSHHGATMNAFPPLLQETLRGANMRHHRRMSIMACHPALDLRSGARGCKEPCPWLRLRRTCWKSFRLSAFFHPSGLWSLEIQ